MDARGHDRTPGQSLNSEINVTPLVDVMLVVLIIFMVVTPLLQVGVGVELPRARHVEPTLVDPDRIVTVVLQADGRLQLGTDRIEPEALAGALRWRYHTDPQRQLQIKADRGAPYGAIKRILRAGRAAGFPGVALVTRDPESPAAARVAAVDSPRRGD